MVKKGSLNRTELYWNYFSVTKGKPLTTPDLRVPVSLGLAVEGHK